MKFLTAGTFALAMMASQSQADGQMSFGITAGASKWDSELEIGNVKDSDDVTDGAFGIAARYTIFSDSNFFGAHIALQRELAEYKIGGIAEIEAVWSADALLRFGRDFGTIAPYIAGGISAVQSDFNISAVRIKESSVHLGWKVAIGSDFALSEKTKMFVQAEYADYGDEEYGDFGVYLNPKKQAVKFGVMFDF